MACLRAIQDEVKDWEQRLRDDTEAQAQRSQQRPFSDAYLNGQRRAPRGVVGVPSTLLGVRACFPGN